MRTPFRRKVRRWRVTEPSGKVWFIYAATKLEAWDRVLPHVRCGLRELVTECVPLDREKVSRSGRDS